MLAEITLMLLLGNAPDLGDELGRLIGQEVEVSKDTSEYQITDIAGEGKPLVGCVLRQGEHLYLQQADLNLRLEGELAVPRLAGPGYKVWIIGTRQGDSLLAKRLGILAPPNRNHCEALR